MNGNSRTRAIVSDSLHATIRSEKTKDKKAIYTYIGANDSKTCEICQAHLVRKPMTISEWLNHDVSLSYNSHPNCRHVLEKVRDGHSETVTVSRPTTIDSTKTYINNLNTTDMVNAATASGLGGDFAKSIDLTYRIRVTESIKVQAIASGRPPQYINGLDKIIDGLQTRLNNIKLSINYEIEKTDPRG